MPFSESRNPRYINAMAYILWSFPITYILVLGTFYNLPAPMMARIFFSFYYIVHSILAIVTGTMLRRVRPWAWHFFLFHSFLLCVEQVVVAYGYAENHIPEIPLALAIGTIMGTVFFLKLELRVPYFSPKIAWWESDPRYKISVPSEMTCSDHFYKGDIMDISASGCFIKTKDPMKVDQAVLVKFSLFDHKFECTGRVVWRTESGVTHPKGVGVRFIGIDRSQQAYLRETVKKLKGLTKSYKSMRNEEKASTMERKVRELREQKKG
jgi:Tfp pilus assembly protein PilZ